jgi:hypothetical protein
MPRIVNYTVLTGLQGITLHIKCYHFIDLEPHIAIPVLPQVYISWMYGFRFGTSRANKYSRRPNFVLDRNFSEFVSLVPGVS